MPAVARDPRPATLVYSDRGPAATLTALKRAIRCCPPDFALPRLDWRYPPRLFRLCIRLHMPCLTTPPTGPILRMSLKQQRPGLATRSTKADTSRPAAFFVSVAPLLRLFNGGPGGDRKSTRLNSSHT